MTHVIITGGSSGIGLALARIYAGRGARISLLARTLSVLEAVQGELAKDHGASTVRIESTDVADESQTVAAIHRCEEAFGPCDILITCAGVVEPGLFEALSSDAFDRQLQTNFSGSIHAVRAVYAGMKARRSGRIMLVSSGAGLIGIHGYTAYCASKFALHGFAEALRSEARPHGIRISVCFPPDTETPQFTRELEHRPPEAAVIMGRVAPWPADAVASRIVRAIDGGEFEVFFGWTLRALGRFGSTVKPFLNWWFDRAIQRISRHP
ncbi:follicular variant translocation protein 1 [Pararhizobium polonicum]|uniref:3-dehydrosphinganine reductase n=1 Tax=Pararhizobium polonicum TaxID=1612624 RepID=A0A1C7P6P9_9HYPH|nr:SDR family oxidoreductase [Pararhizobium polonicum]OBZ96646.1 follicular variant translocation protein 1 [Pararhizobium polonicum]